MNDIETQVDLELKQNRKLLYAIGLVLILISVLLLQFYQDQKRENSALRIKMVSLHNTRPVTPWQRLLSKPQIAPNLKPDEMITDQLSIKAAATKTSDQKKMLTPQEEDRPIQNLSTQELALDLNLRMVEVKSMDLAALEKNIEIADEIIAREPDTYLAYKAKLISMLIEEAKLNHDIDETIVNQTLETMASFDLNSETATKREAVLIADTDNQISTLTNQLIQASVERANIELEMELQDPNSAEMRALEIERINLIKTEEEKAQKISELDSLLESGFPEDNYLNEEVIQIPFFRMMAKNNYDGVIDNAVTFIEQFPDSPEGYFFLIKGYEATGRKEDALRVLEESGLSAQNQEKLREQLRRFTSFDPKTYWEKLNF